MRPGTQMRLAALVIALAGTAFVGYTVMKRPPAGSQSSVDMKRIPTRPSQWWFEQRAFPGTTIPVDAYEVALQQALMDHEQVRLSTSAGILEWEFVGPDNIGGRITALAVAPGGSPIYIGAANGGVHKSTDSGLTFTPIFDDFSAYSIGAITLHPTNPNIIYVGTGESNPAIDTYDGNGVYRSTDAGVTWQHLGPTQVKRINRIVVDPLNPQRILLAGSGSIFTSNSNHGIWRSEDGGANWSQRLFVDNSTWGADIIMNPVHPESLFASMWDFGLNPTESAIYRSTDNGTSWTRLGPAQGLPASNDSTDRIALAYAPSRLSTIYAQVIGGAALSYTGRGMYRSTDGGATWQKRNTGITFTNGFGGFGWYFGSMGVDPTNPDKLYALGVSFLRSTDGGVNWQNLTIGMHVDQHAIWIDPSFANGNRIQVGNDGGFFRTTNGGVTSWLKGGPQGISQFYAITVDPSNASRHMGGTQDNNTLISSGDPGGWTPVLGGDGFYCIIDHTDPGVVFAEFQGMCSGTGPRRSVGGGSFDSPTVGSFNASDRYNWNAPYVMDPVDHNILLAGSHRIYKSTNNGVSYSISSLDLAVNSSSTRPNGTISTISISPHGIRTYYTGSSNGKVYRSTDGGTLWTDKSLGLPTRYVTRVTADAFDSSTVYCSMSGFNGSSEAPVHVYKSTDKGDTWTNISGDLPNAPVNDILVDNLDPNRLYAGTDLGVYTTQNGGASWYPLGQGLPFQAVFDLYLHTGARALFAGTHGRSMWKLDLTQMPLAVGGAPAVTKLALSAPSPNPSRGDVSFSLTLPGETSVQVGVFDAMGRRVRSIHGGALAAGRHAFRWDGRDAAGRPTRAGVYFVRAQSPGGTHHKRIVRTQ